jgi:Family of unknown function (DUF5329)
LSAKYDALTASDQRRTAEDFIEKAASTSSISGRPYQIRCRGSAPVQTNQWFSEALARYRKIQWRQASLHTAVSRGMQETGCIALLRIFNRPV